MKIRLSEGMIRFRLEPAEAGALSAGSSVQEMLPDVTTGLSFELHSTTCAQPSATREDGIRIGLPAAWLADWSDSDVVGFDFDIPENGLRVVVEKDFPCSHGDAKPAPPIRMS
jgi:hypothetical protein